MRYLVDYQFRPKGRVRPLDDGELVPHDFNANEGSAILPNVGDIVSLIKMQEGDVAYTGKVASRYFRYFKQPDGSFMCAVNIVFDEYVDQDGALVKE